MKESALPIPFDASRVNVLRGKSLLAPTGQDIRELCRMLDWCEERFLSIREKIEEAVCTEGCDKGVVMLSQDGPTHYDSELKCQVYDHEFFSPLGDALIAIHDLTDLSKVTGCD